MMATTASTSSTSGCSSPNLSLIHIYIILAVGRDDSLRSSSERLSAALWSKGIGNALRLWDGWSHDWPYWEQMIRLYMGGHD